MLQFFDVIVLFQGTILCKKISFYLAVGIRECQDDDVDDGWQQTTHALAATHVADVLFGEVSQVGHHTPWREF